MLLEEAYFLAKKKIEEQEKRITELEAQRDELIAVCKRAAARQPEALGKMEKHNIVLDDLNNIYQKAAFTFYSMLVQTTQEIEAVFEEQEIKQSPLAAPMDKGGMEWEVK